MGGLTTALLREHKWGYLGAFLSAVLASALVTGSLSLTFAALARDGINTVGHDRYEAGEAEAAGFFMSTIGGLTAIVAILVSVILVSSTMAFVVQGRRRELALLRLSGAGRGHIVGLILRESALLGVVAGVVGALFGVPVGRGYIALFGSTYNLPAGFTVNFHGEAVLIGVLLTAFVTVLGALRPAIRISRVEPIEALSGASRLTKPMTLVRWITGGLAGVGALALFLTPADMDTSVFVYLSLLQGLLALVALVQLAPVVVAPIAKLVCGLLGVVSPGAATLAQGHASWDKARTASLANPALLLLAVPGVFFVSFGSITQGAQVLMERDMNAAVVVEQGPGDALLDVSALAALDGVERAVPQVITRSDWFDQAPGESIVDSGVQLMATDLPGLAQVMTLQSTGDIAAVQGTKVAVQPTSGHALGDRFTLDGPGGRAVELEVVAVVQSTNFLRDVMVDAATFDMQGGAAEHRTTYLLSSPGASVPDLVAAASAVVPEGLVRDKSGWARGMADNDSRQATTSLLIILGGSCLLAVLAIGVSILTSLRERQGEFALSRRAGASPGLVHASTLIESVAVLAIAFALGAGVIAIIWGRAAQNFVATNVGLLPSVPGILGWFVLAGAVMGLVATVGGTAWALKAIRVE